MPRHIPTLRTVHPRYGELCDRIDVLQRELSALDAERNELARSMGQMQQSADKAKLDSVVGGYEFQAPTPLSNRFGEIEDRRSLLRQALHLLITERSEAHRTASTRVCEGFAAERKALTDEMYRGLAAAAAARVRLGLLALEIERTGAHAGGFDQPLMDLFGPALARNSDLAIELRKGICAGFLPASALPQELR